MLKRWYLTIHGWAAVVFALPILGVVLTGLLLSFDPIIQVTSVQPGALTTEKVLGWLAEHDPDNKAGALFHRPYDHSFEIDGDDGEVEIDLRTGREFSETAGGIYWSDWMGWARRTHEHLTIANVELTVISTWIMLLIVVIGILMGLPKIRNTVAGWHKAAAWFLLPLLIVSPLTGLFITYGVTMNFSQSTPPPARPAVEQVQGASPARPMPLTMAEAVRIIGETKDLSTMTWLRTRGGRLLVRLWEGGEARAYVVSRNGLSPANRNFSRIFHEGTFGGIWGGVMNVIISLALMLLSVTGLWLFVTKQIRKYRNRRLRAQWNTAQPAE